MGNDFMRGVEKQVKAGKKIVKAAKARAAAAKKDALRVTKAIKT